MVNKLTFLNITKKEWDEYKDGYYRALFGTQRGDLDSIDYCSLVIFRDHIAGYVTVKELDKKTAYWQLGGVLPKFQNTVFSVKGYKDLIGWFSERYKYIRTRIVNTNTKMLRMALKAGFLIIGTVMFHNKVYVELNYTRGE